MKSIVPSVLLIGLVLVSGCTTHYRESLREYRASEPLPFYQRTQEWVSDTVPEGAASDETAGTSDEVTDQALSPPTPPEDRYVEVAAKVLGVSPAWFAQQASQYGDDASIEGVLSGTVEWQELMLAVSFKNPSVAAAREQWQATLSQYSQAEFLEGLLREYRSFTRFLNVTPGKPLNKEMLQSYFPYPSTITLKGEMIREQVRLAELNWERTLREALIQAGSDFFAYQYQHRATATTQENVQLLEDLVNVVQDRYSTGLASQADVLRLQTELERQRNMLEDLQSQRAAFAAKMNASLGRKADAAVGDPGESDFAPELPSKDELLRTAESNRQEILAQQARVGRTQVAIRMGEVMNRPAWSQGYSTFDRGMMPEATTGPAREPYGVQPDANRPRPDYAQAEAYLAEMRQRLEGEKSTLRQVLADTDALVRVLLEQADIARRQVTLVRDVVLPLDQSAYEIALRGYSAGDESFIDLLDAERKLINAKIELDASRRDHNQSQLNLSRVRGYLTGVAD